LKATLAAKVLEKGAAYEAALRSFPDGLPTR
jgi:hypothetical protein